MQDDWRVEVDLEGHDGGRSLAERLRTLALDDDARERLGERVVVTRDGPRIFLYAAAEAEAKEAERVVRDLLAADDVTADVEITRWHPDEEEWKDASIPLPRTEAERETERRRHEQAEAREAEEEGSYDWHVRAQLRDRGEAAEVERRLEEAGQPVERRWRYLTIGALTEATANELASQLRDELPDDADVWVEVNREDIPNPLFVFLGRFF